MDRVEQSLKIARTQVQRPAPPGAGKLDQRAVEHILRIQCAKDSFVEVEEHKKALAEGVTWSRRRVGWVDTESGEDRGLCLNEVRIASDSEAGINPGVAMAKPGLEDFDAIEHAYWQTVWASGAFRLDRGEKASRLFLNMRELVHARSGAPRGPWEDLKALQARIEGGEDPGELQDLVPIMRPVWRDVPDTEAKVARYLPAFPPSWGVQADASVLVSTNAGYFLNFPEEYEDGCSALHQPIGALYAENQLHMPPWIERPCAVQWVDGIRRIELLGPHNLLLKVENDDPIPLVPGILNPDRKSVV